MLRFALLTGGPLLMLAGCGHELSSGEAEPAASPTPAQPEPEAEAAQAQGPEAPPSLTEATPPAATDGEQIEGLFDIDRIAGGKRFQGSWLELDGGDRLVLSYRPMEEYFAFVEKRVVVEGERYSPEGQAIAASHFRVSSMRLAEGEQARATVPTRLPVPPLCLDAAAVEARLDRWGQVQGTLDRVRDSDRGSDWRDVILKLGDGTELAVMESHRVVDRTYRPHLGKTMTMTGMLLRDDDGGWRLGGASALCEGAVDGCGMTIEPLRR